jgi:hypothetical protein
MQWLGVFSLTICRVTPIAQYVVPGSPADTVTMRHSISM